ncbi:ATP-binding protein [Streptomyces sp. NPDC091219]|uniref:ATP-binding protein n=1 Tax=Streptomyces sp. NPDC091219 TaxID=3155193 RepID=UPI0034507BA1
MTDDEPVDDSPVRSAISGGLFLSPVMQGRDLTLRLPYELPPALAALRTPTPASVGRTDELAALTALLARDSRQGNPVVVVGGPSGCGKTEMVLTATHQAIAQGRFTGGVLFADVSRLHGSALLDGFLRATGLPAHRIPPARTARSALYTLILTEFARAGDPLLIVLDDVTHPDQLAGLLPARAPATTIVTTPVHLGGLGTHRMVLPPLTAADATRLLHRAMTTAHPDDTRVLDHPEDARRVADLCDGLPLALRTAAALLAESPHRPLAALAEDLADPRTRLDELAHPDRDLRTRLDACHARLDPAQARLLRMLALSDEPETTTQTLAALCADRDDTVRDRLTSLLHLIESGTKQESWRMSELVRLYVRARPDMSGPEGTGTPRRAFPTDTGAMTPRQGGRQMDPVSVGLLASLAGGAGGEVGRQVWTGLTTLVRRPFRHGEDGAGGPGTGEDELMRLQLAPGDGDRAHALSTALAVRAALDPDFATALAAWHEQARLVRTGDGAVNNTISGGSFHAPVLQGRDFSDITFDTPTPTPPSPDEPAAGE